MIETCSLRAFCHSCFPLLTVLQRQICFFLKRSLACCGLLGVTQTSPCSAVSSLGCTFSCDKGPVSAGLDCHQQLVCFALLPSATDLCAVQPGLLLTVLAF